ncbi:MAG: chemotaxis protein CheX [Zoogloeaceae bacterium]|jgi:chemotaxis protein CheX|nr:chemotaxis protein CheX [Zoogloeaceae bacterium]
MSAINEKDIRSFVDAASGYFSRLTQEKAEIKAAYLAEGTVPPRTFDLTGYINISGSFRGRIYFSAERDMMIRLLAATGETNRTQAHLLDAVGEVANTLAGNVRKRFGEEMEISVPEVRATDPDWLAQTVSPYSYVILIQWKRHHASVVVDLQAL